MSEATPNPHQLVAFFEDEGELEAAESDLQGIGIDRSQLSMLSRKSFEENELRDGSDVADVAMSQEAQTKPAVSETDLRQGRTMVSGMAGFVGGGVAGAIALLSGAAAAAALPIAAAAGLGVGAAAHAAGRKATKGEVDALRQQLEHGGIVLWVTARDDREEERAIEVLKDHSVRRLAVDGVEKV
jgi:hypothetical protein